jgi:hypothetical protein
LDNRRENLRICTNAQNIQNSKRRSDNTSGFKGVSFEKDSGKWVARVTIPGTKTQKNLGRYDSAEEAGRVYDEAAKMHYGEFALPNLVSTGTLP